MLLQPFYKAPFSLPPALQTHLHIHASSQSLVLAFEVERRSITGSPPLIYSMRHVFRLAG